MLGKRLYCGVKLDRRELDVGPPLDRSPQITVVDAQVVERHSFVKELLCFGIFDAYLPFESFGASACW